MRSRGSTYTPTLIGAALYIAAFALLSWGGYDRVLVLMIVGLGLLIGAARTLQKALVDAPRLVRRSAPVVLIAVGAGSMVLGFGRNPTGGLGLAGVCAVFLGLGHAVTLWRDGDRWKLKRGIVFLIACAVVAVLGVVLCLREDALWLVATGLALLAAPVGIALISEDLFADASSWAGWVWPVGAVLVVAGGGWLAVWTGMTWELALAVMAAGVLLMAAIASNTQSDVLVVAVVCVVVAFGLPRDATVQEPIDPDDGKPALVALGDSYMSGEGAEKFIEGTNDPGRPNECRRAETAYAHRTVQESGVRAYDHLAFYACSGAVGDDLHDNVQFSGEPVDDTPTSGLDQLDQLKALREQHDVDIRLVIVSIGGNDAGFSTIGSACVAPGSCVALGQRWLNALSAVAAEVDTAFQKIRETLDDIQPDVPVLVIPYPVPISDKSCSYSSLGDDEHRFLHAFVGQLNGRIRNVARERDFYVLEDMADAFDTTLRICDGPLDEMGENFIALSSVEGVLDQAINPRNWIHNSFHPNERGHEAMSRVLAEWITAHTNPGRVPGPADEPSAFTPSSLTQLLGEHVIYCGGDVEPDHCDRTSKAWAITQLGLFAKDVSVPALLLAVGAWLLAMGALVAYRRWRTCRRTPDSA